jgi:hypothetical protein
VAVKRSVQMPGRSLGHCSDASTALDLGETRERRGTVREVFMANVQVLAPRLM